MTLASEKYTSRSEVIRSWSALLNYKKNMLNVDLTLQLIIIGTMNMGGILISSNIKEVVHQKIRSRSRSWPWRLKWCCNLKCITFIDFNISYLSLFLIISVTTCDLRHKVTCDLWYKVTCVIIGQDEVNYNLVICDNCALCINAI